MRTLACTWKIKMTLLKYFKKAIVLPNPDGPLSDRMPSSAILSANNEVESLLTQDNGDSSSQCETVTRKRG